MIRIIHIFNMYISLGGSHGEKESIKDIVLHHLMDHVYEAEKGFWWFIAKFNNTYLSEKLFGIFDMRITKNVLMMWLSGLLCMLVFIPVARRLKRAKYG